MRAKDFVTVYFIDSHGSSMISGFISTSPLPTVNLFQYVHHMNMFSFEGHIECFLGGLVGIFNFMPPKNSLASLH